jgi:aryl sulfotransferase
MESAHFRRLGGDFMLIQPARREYRTWIIDSRRWQHVRPRPTDIVIATHPKCGTTWMQRIVDLLVFQSLQPRPIMEISPWIDRRFPEPLETVLARIEAQDHRRFLKSHLPFDGLPIYDGVKYIHVARDGRDVVLSHHNHALGFTSQMLEALDRAGLDDDTIRRPYPRVAADPASHFHGWLTEGAMPGSRDGTPAMSFFHCEQSWWDQQQRVNVLLVHYHDLKADLAGEMRRVADFLDIRVAPDLWPALVEAAGFEAMRRDGAALMGNVADTFQGGSSRFFHKGTNERWRGVFSEEDLLLYEAKAATSLSPPCRVWVADGWRRADDDPLAQSSEGPATEPVSVS